MTKPFINITILLVLTLGIVYATNTKDNNSEIAYTTMSTTELQIKVEKLSTQGNLPFEMGLELINRWSEHKQEVN